MKKKAEDGAEIKTSSDYALKIFSLTGIVFFLIFSVVYLLKGDLFAGIVEITIAFTFFLNLIFLTKHKNIDSASSFALLALIPFYLFILTTGGIANTGLFWLHPFPVAALYFKGSKKGLVLSIFLGLILVVIFIFKLLGIYVTPFSLVEIRQALASYILLNIFIYFYQKGNESKQKLVEEKEKEVNKRQEELVKTMGKGKTLESQFEQERDKLNLIINSMGEGLLVVDKDYKIRMINHTAELLLGVKEKKVLGTEWHKLANAYIGGKEIPFKQRVSIQVLNKAVTIQTVLEDDHYYLVKSSGRKFPIVSVTTPIFEDSKVVGAVKVFSDATQEKEAKILIEEAIKSKTKELKYEQQRSHAILENTGEGVILTNDKGKITYVNPAFEKMSGYDNDYLSGKDFSETIKAYDLKENEIPPAQISDAAAVTAEKQEMKLMLQKKEGEKIGVIINSAPVRSQTNFIGVVRVIHDVTDDLQLQQQKDDFFSIASHELRTPLSVITGNLDTVLAGYGKSQMTKEDLALLQDSMDASDRLIKMVGDFLNISRLDQGRLNYEIRQVDACFVIESVVHELMPLIENKGIKLSYTCINDPKHKMVLVDENLLKEILINLIGNSLKFTDKGEIKIEHGLKDNMSYIKVIDPGVGIAKDKQKLLFQRFQQAMNRTLAREAGGTGLGLYISREFARVMGGDLVLEESELGKGSIFSFTLPLANSVK
ncbi:hypothetical protein A2Z22_05220 [Candidatus Woesebacteria bacterium RBG_16_34_12]|uniref:histidine kinase n=1 Tax=Candidatus Woesebacteria bacterium RBG_16_34_12 TaxID=1802480 RepID=A0A1F7XBQ6_9BACT|nr:MAG: hypothetical protein A2Z22_05220 [Candidatus Woesebacteria bacterium RBG_16_34_12]